MELLSKNPQNYEKIRYDVLLFEQKQIKIDDDFNETEEKEIKECVEKRKLKMREVAEKITLLKKKRNKRKIKKEAEMWTRLRELNNEFKYIKEQKEKDKKIYKTIIKTDPQK